MRNKVLKSSTHALLPCGAWLTFSHMERTFIHLADHTTSERFIEAHVAKESATIQQQTFAVATTPS